ncbi:MAG: Mut7-C RNAse domain-containing protein, partial [Patescibacteria group bacterium]
MFSRCTICNQELSSIDKTKIKEKVPVYVYNTQENFFICAVCNRIYWQGTHWGNVKKTLEEYNGRV